MDTYISVSAKGRIHFYAIVTSNKKRRRGIRKDKDKKKTRPFLVKVGDFSRAKVC